MSGRCVHGALGVIRIGEIDPALDMAGRQAGRRRGGAVDRSDQRSAL